MEVLQPTDYPYKPFEWRNTSIMEYQNCLFNFKANTIASIIAPHYWPFLKESPGCPPNVSLLWRRRGFISARIIVVILGPG